MIDTYQAGIPCQWIDITHYKTTDSPITARLSANMNPDNMLCEGELYRDQQGNFIWERTNFTAVNGETVYKPKCKTGTNPSTLANNFDQVEITTPKDGNGYVTVCIQRDPFPKMEDNLVCQMTYEKVQRLYSMTVRLLIHFFF